MGEGMGEGRERGWERVGSKQATSTAGPFLGPRAARVPKSKKMLPRYFPSDPRWSQRVIYWGFGPFWAAGT